VAGDRLSFARLIDHEQLWHNSKGLQVDAPSPQNLIEKESIYSTSYANALCFLDNYPFHTYFHHAEFVIDDEGQKGDRDKQKFNSKKKGQANKLVINITLKSHKFNCVSRSKF